MAKTTIKGSIVLEYLSRFPDTPSLTLAKKIYKENKTSFNSLENVRGMIRQYRGQHGNAKRKNMANKTHFKEAGSRNPFDFLPQSHSEDFTPYQISQSKTLIISDLHIPYHDNKAIEQALSYGLKKDVGCILINGDLFDFAGISRHEKDWRQRTVTQEFEAVRAFLNGLRAMFPKAKIVFKEGNHCERWEKWLFLKAPEIFDDNEFKLETRLRLAELKIDYVRDKRPVQIGKLTVLHGHELAGGSGGVNPARATFLKTLSSVLVGHYHKTSSHTERTMLDDVISVQSMGCLCGMNPHYMPINKWNHGFCYVELDVKTGEYHLENKQIIKGKVY